MINSSMLELSPALIRVPTLEAYTGIDAVQVLPTLYELQENASKEDSECTSCLEVQPVSDSLFHSNDI